MHGARAMPACASVWCGPDAGWIGLDPTTALVAGYDHITLAFGRDYSDVASIDGIVFATGGPALAVSVSVTPVARP